MSISLNNISIGGNLTRDPELKYIPNGKAVCSFSIANNQKYTSNGEQVEEVSFVGVTVWGKSAENCEKYLKKGSGVIIEGRIKQDRWDDNGQKREKIKIIASKVHFLPKGEKQSGSAKKAESWDE